MLNQALDDLRVGYRRQFASAAVGTAVGTALLFLDGQLGPLSGPLRRATAAGILTLIAAFQLGPGGRWRTAAIVPLIAALTLVTKAPSMPIALVGFTLALTAVDFAVGWRVTGARSDPGLVPSCVSYVSIRFVSDLIPHAGRPVEAVAQLGSRYMSLLHRPAFPAAHLSFTALGGPAMGIGVLYLLWTWRRGGRARLAAAALVIPILWFALLPAVTPDAMAGPVATFWRGAFHGLFWMAAASVLAAIPANGVRRSEAPSAIPQRWSESRFCTAVPLHIHSLPTGAAGIAAAVAGVCLVGTSYITPPAARSVRVLNNGGLDWDRPTYGRFGAFSGGMFGTWPVYCRAEGYDFGVIEYAGRTVQASVADSTAPTPPAPKDNSAGASRSRIGGPDPVAAPTKGEGEAGRGWEDPDGFQDEADAEAESARRANLAVPAPSRPAARVTARAKHTIEPADLESTQILVLINSATVWDARERRVILDFVARGGSLLVLGDHTDVFGLMRGFNSLLGPIGVQFQFDSAYRAREGWRGCQVAAPDAVTWGWDEENPGVAVGASLALSGSARPLLLGRYGFSDRGVRENVAGSFLGNYRYDAGERLGDVVLAATATHGAGRVVVWGDTSAFQNVSFHYPTVIGPMLAWLSRPAAWTERPAIRMGAALGLLAAIAWLWTSHAGTREHGVVAFGLMLGLVSASCLGIAYREARVTVDHNVLLLDRSHLPARGHYHAHVNPSGPLYTNLLRSGFRITEMQDWAPGAIKRAKGVAFIAPQRSFTRAEVEDLLRAEDGGLVVILAVGHPDSAGPQRVLDAHHLKLVPRPLGTVSSADPSAGRREREMHPRFLDAWPITSSDGGDPLEAPGVEIIYRHGDDVVALFRRVGRGGLLLISDTRFFSDMNVEDMSGYWLGNLALIHDMFKKYLGADPDSVKPLFRSPEKPR
jgi:hypothetical protein